MLVRAIVWWEESQRTPILSSFWSLIFVCKLDLVVHGRKNKTVFTTQAEKRGDYITRRVFTTYVHILGVVVVAECTVSWLKSALGDLGNKRILGNKLLSLDNIMKFGDVMMRENTGIMVQYFPQPKLINDHYTVHVRLFSTRYPNYFCSINYCIALLVVEWWWSWWRLAGWCDGFQPTFPVAG